MNAETDKPATGWPRWAPGVNGPQALASYTGIDAARHLEFEVNHPIDMTRDEARKVVANIYDRIVKAGYRYSVEDKPWSLSQVIRDPYAMHQGKATCLDLALFFAAACKLNDVRPMIVIKNGESEGHALVIVDLATRTHEELCDDWYRALNLGLRPHDAPNDDQRTGAEAVAHGLVGPGWNLGDRHIAVDVIQAMQGAAHDFTTACDYGTRELTEDGEASVTVVEVVHALLNGVPEFEVPREKDREVLHTMQAPPPAIKLFPSRADLSRQVGRSGVVVLLGPSGTGKSTLARDLANKRGRNVYWWLDAASEATLIASYAQAEALETDDAMVLAENSDVKKTAEFGLRRLQNAAGPWTVVFDNADGKPEDLLSWVPSDLAEGQLLLITSANEAWREVREAKIVPVTPVSDEDLTHEYGAAFPPEIRPLIGGLPLLAAASERFRTTAGVPWWQVSDPGPGATPDVVPARLWSAAVTTLGADHPAVRLGTAACWLPPVAFDPAVLADVRPDIADVEAAASDLADHGILERAAGRYRMHRLIQAAVLTAHRSRPSGDGADSVTPLLRSVIARGLIADSYDPQTVERLREQADEPGRTAASRAEILYLLGNAVDRYDVGQADKLFTTARTLVEHSEADLAATFEPDPRYPDEPQDWQDLRDRIIADALRSSARQVIRDQRNVKGRSEQEKQTDQAIAYCVRVEELCRDREGGYWHQVWLRTIAMHGLALRQKGGYYKTTDRERARNLFAQSEDLLTRSHEGRLADAKGRPRPDVDRSRFNLAGLEVQLAQVARPDECAGHLDKAEKHYRAVRRMREERLRTSEHEDVACCINGIGVVDYLRATYLDLSSQERALLLRRAQESTVKAERIRAQISPAKPHDGPDTSKSVKQTVLIGLARLRNNQAAGVPGETDISALVQYGLEWGGMAPRSTWMIGSDRKADVIAAAEGGPAGFEEVPPVGTSADLTADVLRWASSEPIRALVAAFATDEENVTELFALRAEEPAGFLRGLEKFTDRWDTRNGRERNLAGELALTPHQASLALEAAQALGLRSPGHPQSDHYDHVLLLGGLVRACFQRPAYAARLLLSEKTVSASSVVALGARRPLNGDEHALARAIGAPELADADEYEALDTGTRRAFNLGKPATVRSEPGDQGPNSGWEARTYVTESGLTVTVAAAPSSQPKERRANTADGYAWFADTIAQRATGQRILAVTTDIYRPYQHIAALRMLARPFHMEVETVGHVPSGVDPVLRQPFSPGKYLQEIRSAVRACRELHDSVAGDSAARER